MPFITSTSVEDSIGTATSQKIMPAIEHEPDEMAALISEVASTPRERLIAKLGEMSLAHRILLRALLVLLR